MIYNYHTHTQRCGHATGTEEEYILRAIKNGIKYMGFSDHAPNTFPDGYEATYRVPTKDALTYINELRELRDKYKDQIDIKIGFEMEYYPNHFERMLKNVIDFGAEYLICGHHFVYEEHPNGQHSGHETNRIEDLCEFVKCVTSAIKSGVFTYIAHPDFFNFTGDGNAYNTQMRKICDASKEYNVPLEINFLGIRENRIYPSDRFFRIVGEVGSPVTFGFDAHTVESAYDGDSIAKAKALVEKYNLNYIGKPEIVEIQKLKR